LFHTQFIANSAEEALIIEPTLRCPGDLYSRLVELSLDTPYAENYWRPFLELPPIITKAKAGSHVVRHTVTFDYSGRFLGLQLSKPLAVKEFYPLMRVGERHSKAPAGRAGVLFLQFPTAEAQAGACESLLDRSALKYPTLEAEAEEGVAECAS
jgi:hypothetical protein